MASLSLLNPKTDFVFKRLLTRYEHLTRAMLEAILRPPSPIEELEFLDPDPANLDKLLPDDIKDIVLDVRIRLRDGSSIVVEMQSQCHAGFYERLLYYGAKLFSAGLHRGSKYNELRPVVVIVWLNDDTGPARPFHQHYLLTDRYSPTILSQHFSIHLLDIPKGSRARTSNASEQALERWARFFSIQSQDELDWLAGEDPVMMQAKNALEELSADPQTRALAEAREMFLVGWNTTLAMTKAEGKAEGEVSVQRKVVSKLVEHHVGQLSAAASNVLANADLNTLEHYFDALVHGTLPDALR